MKRFIKRVIRFSGLLSIINQLTFDKLNVMLYHGFAADKDFAEPIFRKKFLPISEFEQHLKLYLKYGTPVSLSDLASRRRLPRNPIIVTIDDGYANNYSLGFPVLKRNNFPATIFVTTSFVNRETLLWTDWLEYVVMNGENRTDIFKWNHKTIPINLENNAARKQCLLYLKSMLKTSAMQEIMKFIKSLQKFLEVELTWARVPEPIRPLDWEQIRDMKDSGLISFGSHTISHPILSMCDVETQRREIYESKRTIEENLGAPCFMFAYPNGKKRDYSSVTMKCLKENGYVLAVNTESGYNNAKSYGKYDLNRWGTDISMLDLECLVSGLGRIYRSNRQFSGSV